MRRKYNEFGPKESAPEGGFVDPEELFSNIFGGDRFLPIIGQISLAKDMKSALQEADEQEEESTVVAITADGRPVQGRTVVVLSPEEKAKREEKARIAAAEVRARIYDLR